MESNTTELENPSSSKDFLQQFVGKTVTGLVRYSWWKKEDVPRECNISREQTFSLTAGPLAVVFEGGSILGVASDPGINSVVVWLECVDEQAKTTQALSEDEELFPINASDETYSEPFWSKFFECTLTGFSILKRTDMNAKQECLPSEVGLCFFFGENNRFVASHGLHNGTDAFSIIVDSQIDPIVKEKLEELPLL